MIYIDTNTQVLNIPVIDITGDAAVLRLKHLQSNKVVDVAVTDAENFGYYVVLSVNLPSDLDSGTYIYELLDDENEVLFGEMLTIGNYNADVKEYKQDYIDKVYEG